MVRLSSRTSRRLSLLWRCSSRRFRRVVRRHPVPPRRILKSEFGARSKPGTQLLERVIIDEAEYCLSLGEVETHLQYVSFIRTGPSQELRMTKTSPLVVDPYPPAGISIFALCREVTPLNETTDCGRD